MKDAKVLMYGWEFPPKISGGLGVACYAIVKELVRKRVNLTLVLPYTITDEDERVGQALVSGGAIAEELIHQGADVGKLKVQYSPIASHFSTYTRVCDFSAAWSKDDYQEFISQLAQLSLPPEINDLAIAAASRNRFAGELGGKYETNLLTEVFRYAWSAGPLAAKIAHQVIHAHDWLTVLAALEAKRRSGKPVVLHIHALETDRGGVWIDQRIYAIEKYGMEQVDQIIAVSQFTKDNIVRHYQIAPDKITVIHNGVYADHLRRTAPDHPQLKHPKTVLFLGRITQQKGPTFFVEVARKVLTKRPDVHFVLAGTGDLLRSTIEQVAALRIGKNVHFTGFLAEEQVSRIYHLADVYVMPSVSEPFGLSALEAVSCGVPAVISRQSGVAEVLRHALVSDFWDVDDMATKILALLGYPALRDTTLSHAQEELKLLTWDNAAEKIVNLYRKLIKDGL